MEIDTRYRLAIENRITSEISQWCYHFVGVLGAPNINLWRRRIWDTAAVVEGEIRTIGRRTGGEVESLLSAACTDVKTMY